MVDDEKIGIFQNIFRGRADAYGAGAGICVKEELTPKVLLRHFQGKRRIGMYPLAPGILDGACVYWACMDIDVDDFNIALDAINRLEQLGIKGYIERSKSKGFHIWIFFDDAIQAYQARSVLRYANSNHEIFPKQNRIKPGGYGNYVNLPLFGSDVPQGRTIFVDPTGKMYPDQWAFLQGIQKAAKANIGGLFESGELEPVPEEPEETEQRKTLAHDYAGILSGKPESNSRTENLEYLIGYFINKRIPKNIAIEISKNWDTAQNIGLDAAPEHINQYPTGKVAGTVEDMYKRYSQDEPEPVNLELVKACDMLASDMPKPEMYFDKILPKNGYSVIASFTKEGKTTLAKQIILSLLPKFRPMKRQFHKVSEVPQTQF